MVILDMGVRYKVCDECGERFGYDDPRVLSGLWHYEPEKMGDVCLTCCISEGVDVCHGSCLKWHRKIALNEEGLCVFCEGDRIAFFENSTYIKGDVVGKILHETQRDYDLLRKLMDEANSRSAILGLIYELHKGGAA